MVKLLGNQEKKRSHSDKEMKRKERVTENVLDVVIQIISLTIVQNHLATKIKNLHWSDDPSSLDNDSMQVEYDRKQAYASHKAKNMVSTKRCLELLHMDLFGPSAIKSYGGRKPSLEYFKVFRSKCFILNTKDYLTKFNPKLYEGVFLGYSQNGKAYVALNKHTMKVEESLNVTFDESPPPTKLSPLIDDDVESLNVTFDESPPPTKLSPLIDDDVGEEEAIRKNTNIIKEMLKKFGLKDSKPTITPMSTEIKLTKDDEADSVDSSKYQGDYVDRKSTSSVWTFMGCCLTYWFAKKKTAFAISMIEAEYMSTRKACQQALWMKQALIYYDIRLDDVSILCDNKGAIDLSKNLVQHSRTKHSEIRHHLLRDNVHKGNISIEKVASEDNIADIFTNPLKHEVINYLRLGLGMMKLIMDRDSPSSQK
uniref:Copia protein n=1 Tax=Tanacetum cinerariifolium TaxID=118510 RepID=A0A6L2MT91_TANCI|nr:copia protein [Tanacetum cinerariifolium]